MSEEILEMHMHRLRGIGESHAKAKQNLERLQHGRKILLAVLMKEKMINSNTGRMDSAVAQEREARADERYRKHIEELSAAVGEESKWHWEKKMIEINFETWKTKMINQMREAKAYGVQKN
jgi:hypothetical protein